MKGYIYRLRANEVDSYRNLLNVLEYSSLIIIVSAFSRSARLFFLFFLFVSLFWIHFFSVLLKVGRSDG